MTSGAAPQIYNKKLCYDQDIMRAYFFALVASAATAFSQHYTQSYVQTDSELDDDVQLDQPIEMPEVETEPNMAHAGAVAASVRRHHKSQVNA